MNEKKIKSIYNYYGFFIVVILILSSCKHNSSYKNKDALRYILTNELESNNYILNLIDNQNAFQRTIPVKYIYRLNKIALAQIDTSSLFSNSLDNIYTKNLDIFVKEYKELFDSILQGSVVISGQQEHDAVILGSRISGWRYKEVAEPHFNYISKFSGLNDNFIQQLYILKTHNSMLVRLLKAYSPSSCSPTPMPKLNVIIKTDKDSNQITMQLKIIGGSKWLPKRLIELRGKDKISIRRQQIIGDNLILVTDPLEPGEYNAEIEYNIIEWGGGKWERPLNISFDIL